MRISVVHGSRELFRVLSGSMSNQNTMQKQRLNRNFPETVVSMAFHAEQAWNRVGPVAHEYVQLYMNMGTY
jgi:hypothetical protein